MLDGWMYEASKGSISMRPDAIASLIVRSEKIIQTPCRSVALACSSLMAESRQLVERVRGIEPPFQAWEARVLPLNYTRNRHDLTNLRPRGFWAVMGIISGTRYCSKTGTR